MNRIGAHIKKIIRPNRNEISPEAKEGDPSSILSEFWIQICLIVLIVRDCFWISRKDQASGVHDDCMTTIGIFEYDPAQTDKHRDP